MNYIDYETLKYNPCSVKVGDRFIMNNITYVVNEIKYEYENDIFPTIRFNLEPLMSLSLREYEEYINPSLHHLSLITTLEHQPVLEKEISENTRKEFVKLLE